MYSVIFVKCTKIKVLAFYINHRRTIRILTIVTYEYCVRVISTTTKMRNRWFFLNFKYLYRSLWFLRTSP